VITGVGIIVIAAMCLPVILGLFTGLPRWTSPSVGLLLFYFALSFATEVHSGPLAKLLPSSSSRLVQWIVYESVWALGLLIGAGAVVLIAAALPPLRSFYRRVRQDWTQVSFVLYGAALGVLHLTYDEYVYEEPFKVVAILALAGGAWVYLHSTSRRKRALALLAGLTLAMAVAAVGKWLLHPIQLWPPSVLRAAPPGSEVLGAAIDWGWMIVTLLIPALCGWLLRRRWMAAIPRTLAKA
jgi:hypothetical protein